MTSTDFMEKIAMETIGILNTTALHDMGGRNRAWVRGMVNHHLNVLISQCNMITDITHLVQSLQPETIQMIAKCILEWQASGGDIKHIELFLVEAGLYETIFCGEDIPWLSGDQET